MASWGIGNCGLCFGSICSQNRRSLLCVRAHSLALLCPTLLSPLLANLAEILHGKWARVRQQMIGILLMCIEVCGHSGWKTVKNRWVTRFLTRFDWRCGRLLGPLWADPAEISYPSLFTDCSAPCGPIRLKFHTLARLPHEISARLANRGPSKVGQRGASEWALTHSNDCRLWLQIDPKHNPQFPIPHEAIPLSIIHQKKGTTSLYHHVKLYQDSST